MVVGQFPPVDGTDGEQWGMLFEQGQPARRVRQRRARRACASPASSTRSPTTWMAEDTDVPIIDLE